MKCRMVLLVLAIGCRTAAGDTSDLPPLRLIEPACTFDPRTIGLSERALFLKCGSVSVRLYHPKNLIGLVHLGSEEAALQYVRFFTSTETFHFFGLHGFVEVLPSRTKAVPGRLFYVVPDSVFNKHLSDVEVSSREDSLDGMVFTISRPVVALDNRIYRITERVTRGGNYDMIARSLVANDASLLGIAHLGNN
jgi:hypothetical protein